MTEKQFETMQAEIFLIFTEVLRLEEKLLDFALGKIEKIGVIYELQAGIERLSGETKTIMASMKTRDEARKGGG